jgi:diguanylate cyclase (GGDEF)-like protein/PAS domain S-box-containing protein
MPDTAKKSLNTRIIVGIVVIVTLVYSVHAFFEFEQRRTAISEAVATEARETLVRLSQHIAPFIESYAVNDYEQILANEIEVESHEAIIVHDLKTGEILGRDRYLTGWIRSDSGGIEPFDAGSPLHRARLDRALLKETVDIHADDGERLGDITLYEGRGPLNNAVSRIARDKLMISVAMGTLLAVLLVVFARSIVVRPLRELTESVKTINPDNLLLKRLPDPAYHEVAVLTNAIRTASEIATAAQEKLREEHLALQHVVEGTGAGIWIWHIGTGRTEWDERLFAVLGYMPEELEPTSIQTWERLTHPKDLKQARKALQGHIDGKTASYQVDMRMRHKDGGWIWVESRGKVSEWDREGRPSTLSGILLDITEKKKAEMALRDSENRFRSFFEQNSSVMLLIEPTSGVIADANHAAIEFYGYPAGELIGMPISGLNTLSDDEVRRKREAAARGEENRFHFKHRLANGEIRHVEVYSTPIVSREVPLLFSIVHDVTERVEAQSRLALTASVFTHALEAIMITDASGKIIEVNDAFTRITGYDRAEVLGRDPSLLKSDVHDEAFYRQMWSDLRRVGHWSGEIWNRRKDRQLYAELLTISEVVDDQRGERRYVALFSDITALKENERELKRIAHYDGLTGLPNRLLLSDRLSQAMAQTQRHGQIIAVAFLDLDGFKEVNDEHGHDVGDELLRQLANRLGAALRASDTLARLGGDEFVIILPELDDTAGCADVLERIIALCSEVLPIGGRPIRISASVGVTFYPQAAAVDADQLIRQADQAMYQAKLAGKNQYQFFDTDQDRALRGRHESRASIEQAVANDEFVLLYQPKVNMRTGRVVGAEALIRWDHPDKGRLTPDRFLPDVEGRPEAMAIDRWVLDQALSQLDAWRRQGVHLPISVNVSAYSLQQDHFVSAMREVLDEHPDVHPDQVEFEVLETGALERVDHVVEVIREFDELGISFALDDFGTGYSSLTYLKRLPARTLKIDKTFVHDMVDDPEDLAILEGIIGLATAFRLQVVAEGVETREHGNLLLWLGCEVAQGYAIARPMEADDLVEWMAEWRPFPDWLDRSSLHRDELSVVFAMVEHRHWMAETISRLRDSSAAFPMLNVQQCPLGRWLHDRNQKTPPAMLSRLIALHDTVHATAIALLTEQARDRSAGDSIDLTELMTASDRLIEGLEGLILEHKTPPGSENLPGSQALASNHR